MFQVHKRFFLILLEYFSHILLCIVLQDQTCFGTTLRDSREYYHFIVLTLPLKILKVCRIKQNSILFKCNTKLPYNNANGRSNERKQNVLRLK